MKKTTLAFAAANMLLFANVNAAETQATFTVSAPMTESSCGINAVNPTAILGEKISFTVVTEKYTPFVAVTSWNGNMDGTPDSININDAYLKGISRLIHRPVKLLDGETEGRSSFSLNKRKGKLIKPDKKPAELTVEVVCYDDQYSYEQAMIRYNENKNRIYNWEAERGFDFETNTAKHIPARFVPDRYEYDLAPGWIDDDDNEPTIGE